MCFDPRGVTLIFCGYIGEAPASTPKPKKLLRFADHPKKIPVLSGIPKKILELLAYPKKLHVFIFFMSIDEILSHPYDLSCWWDVKSQINQPTEHVTIQVVYKIQDTRSLLRITVYVGTRKYMRGSRAGGGGTGGPDPHLPTPPRNLKFVPEKKVISGFWGGWTPPRL